mmetsp:Transcript_36197/g.90839  ORF Transcript_36197/g.90839 Transcript_36197/m.90839 type:complete len:139 (+) Transcript_36197:72-488(+)|eukprot:CAMPEP_0177628346 /NCGR_PEP_ID=MMETSP0447-20121125/82_1 /TAXON_ID=0 /ORGANISM="Stygamoeba regulata, Strain BSH-02190019" /LENGTH=138 /DNA_ID=CAMNT_0019129587 /DNA_START=47 /DNA_END=463 /DNA_ORIENTATION=-
MASFDHLAAAELVRSDSKSGVDTKSIAQQAKENYQLVAATIKQFGVPNETYPADVDCYYGDLCEHTADKLEGLGTILKNMKREKLVDFHSHGILQPDSIVTLIQEEFQQFCPVMVTYEEITKVFEDKNETSHTKTGIM